MIEDPNVILPLASSYNERGNTVVSDGSGQQDQFKLNCFYEVAKNPMTGKGTLTLSKRFGVIATELGGSISQNVYFVIQPLNFTTSPGSILSSAIPAAIVQNGNDINYVSNSAKTIMSSSSHEPAYYGTTFINTSLNTVVQMANLNSFTQRVFYSTTPSSSWTEISDGDFTALNHRGQMIHMDGFAFILTTENKIYNSSVNSLQSWAATDFISKQMTTDEPMGLAKYNNQVLAFGLDTVEVFYNGGNATGSPLLPIKQRASRIGLMVPNQSVGGGNGQYFVTASDRMYFAGRQGGRNGTVRFFSYNGEVFEPVSTPYIDKILTGTPIYSVNYFSFNGQDAISVALNSVTTLDQQSWLVYFPKVNEWFQWYSTVFSPVGEGGYFSSCGTNKRDIFYMFSTSTYQDAGVSFPWVIQFRLPTNGSSQKRMISYGVDADTDTILNDVTVDVSDDDCQSFYSLRPLALTQDRKMNFRGGSFRKRHIRLSATNSRPMRIHSFLARIE